MISKRLFMMDIEIMIFLESASHKAGQAIVVIAKNTDAYTVPVFWPKTVQSVVKSLVESALSQTTEKTKGNDFPKSIQDPAK